MTTDTQAQEKPAFDFVFPDEALEAPDISEILSIKNQAPVLAVTGAWNLAELVHRVPSARTPRRTTRIAPGDPAPDFTLENTDGETVSLADLRGRPVVVILARAMRTGNFCPISTGSMDDLRTTYEAYGEANVHVIVVAATNVAEARDMVDAWALPYPLYANPDFSQFEAYDVGYLGHPLHGWAVIDGDGIVQYVYRTIDNEQEHPVPTTGELLEKAKASAA